MYPAHIYTTQYKETKLHQSSRQKIGAPDFRQFCPSFASFPEVAKEDWPFQLVD
jgi:hypothetical protein